MTAKRQKKSKGIQHYYSPVGCMLCQDVLHEKNELVSLLRIIDQVVLPLPARIQLWFVAEFACNYELDHANFHDLNAIFQLRLRNPKGDVFELVDITASPHPPERPLTIQRFMVNLTGGIAFQSEGHYTFELHGKIHDDEYELLMSRWFNMIEVVRPTDDNLEASQE